MSGLSRMQAVLVGLLGVAVGLMGGCGKGAEIELSYVKPPKSNIPTEIKRLAVAEFVCTESSDGGWGSLDPRLAAKLAKGNSSDSGWGSVAADKLGDMLDCCNREFKRYELVDRGNLAKIIGEQDIRVATNADAGKVGKIADVHAVIYGKIVVKHSDEMAQKMQFHLLSFSFVPKYYTKRYVYVSVNLTMTDVNTSMALLTRTPWREFDSDKDNEGLKSVLGFSSDTPEPVAQTVNKMLDFCIQEFVQQISPYRLRVQDCLEIGKGKLVERGNALASHREYAEALDCFRKALAETPDDDGAAFNAGLMCEATGDMSKADEYYTNAFDLKITDKYVNARKRAREEAPTTRPANAETPIRSPLGNSGK